mgnify:CR=1 FL=1|jgi:ADP-heptose:LPS heptosyltransferase|tara:strand:- start:36 stop:854 length:819 start_codon:yes stop_codon:yes gene_type:complete
MTNDLYILQGGIGKNICFTSCLTNLNKVNIMSSWPKVFYNHPNVNYSYQFLANPLKNNVKFFKRFNKINFIDGYDSHFFTNKIHLVKNFRKIMRHNKDEEVYNEIYFTDNEEEDIKRIVLELESYVLVQFMGTDEQSVETDFIGSRGLIREQAQKIVDILNFDLKLNVLNVYSKSDLLKNTAKIENTKFDYMNYAHLLKYAKGFIGIDSSLNHMSANKFCNTKGVVLWNDDNVIERFSYDKNINMVTNTPKVMRFDVNEVVDNFEKIRSTND